MAMLYVLHVSLALIAFLIVLNGFLRGSRKDHIDAVLSILLVINLATAFVVFGWRAGLVALVLAFLYAYASRPLAVRLAARLFAKYRGTSGQYIGLPPQQLAHISQDLERLLDFCEANPEIRKVMEEFDATRVTLKELYHQLLMAGAGQWAGGHYVPASALAYPHTLRYLLKRPRTGRDALQQTGYSLLMHFETGSSLE